MVMLKLCAIALAAVVLIGILRIYRPELVPEAVLAASLLLLFYIAGSISQSFLYLEELYGKLSDGTKYVPVILKTLGIAYVTEFTSAICQDAGEKSISGKVELAGKIAIFFSALPVFTSLLDLLNSLLA